MGLKMTEKRKRVSSRERGRGRERGREGEIQLQFLQGCIARECLSDEGGPMCAHRIVAQTKDTANKNEERDVSVRV